MTERDTADTSSENDQASQRPPVVTARIPDTEARRHLASHKVPDEQAWSALLAKRQVSKGVLLWAMLCATSLILVLARIRVTLRGRDPIPGMDVLFYPSLGVLGLCVLVAAWWLWRNWK